MRQEPIQVTRACIATAIPSGEKIELRPGEKVVVSQALGGTFTVMTADGYLVRIAAPDADAIGQTPPVAKHGAEAHGDLSLEERIQAELKTVYDPEIPVDIVELGLVYGTEVSSLPEGGQQVHVQMTMTAPGCGMGDILREEVLDKLRALPGVKDVKVEIVLDPPWEPSRMSEAARLATGIFW
ncbi:MAG: putative Fe-S cluster assembly protein SufT [Deltaproteobacteria bacterium]|nr:putative Fe-S cluster assembly protein SufT [Deltaproteobacteria bacterium]